MSGRENSNLFVWVLLRCSNIVWILHFVLYHCHRRKSGSPIESDHTDGTKLGSYQFLNISYNDPENFTREVQLRSPGTHCSVFPWTKPSHPRDQHGRDRQQHDLYAGLVSTKRRPRIPLVSHSIFEVALFLRYIYILMCSQHDGGTPENVVINDEGGRYDSWNLLQVNYWFPQLKIDRHFRSR